jgi:hypothetical protein
MGAMKISNVAARQNTIQKEERLLPLERFKPDIKISPPYRELASREVPAYKPLSQFEEVMAVQVNSQERIQKFSLTSTLLRFSYDSQLSVFRNIKGNS